MALMTLITLEKMTIMTIHTSENNVGATMPTARVIISDGYRTINRVWHDNNKPKLNQIRLRYIQYYTSKRFVQDQRQIHPPKKNEDARE